MKFVFLAFLVVLIAARQWIANALRSDSRPYSPSRYIELGMLIFSLGVILPITLAEQKILPYDLAFPATAGLVVTGLVIGLVGLAKELKRNFFG